MEDARVPGTTEANKAQQTTLDKRPFSERKAALNLAQMAKFDAILSPDKVKNLIEILVVSR